MAEQPGAGGASLDELDYAGGGLAKETNWWGAFVIGLAGTILVTGIAPVMVTSLGAASIPLIIVITITGYLLCLLLAELSAMMPERTGGSPSYAYPAYKDRWPRAAKHINGITSWMYWLGWFPVAPLNMILASFYLADRFGLNTDVGLHADQHVHRVVDARHRDRRDPALLHPRLPGHPRRGRASRRCSGVISMVPLTFLAVAFLFTGDADWGQLSGFHQLDGSGFFIEPRRPRLVPALHGLRVPADLERDRHGGGGLLHRRDARSRDATRRSR